jgi:lipopolysaccharide export system protein LptA
MKYFLLCIGIVLNGYCYAQVATTDSSVASLPSNKMQIKYIFSDSLLGTLTNGKAFNRLLSNVSLEHNGTNLVCDSAHFYQADNFVEAFSNVHITTNNGAIIDCQYLKYTGNNNTAYLKGNVVIIDGNNQIQGEEVTYNTKTKIAKYNKRATLLNENTELTSNIGNYDGKSKMAYFKGDVVITDPKYTVESKELKYNTAKKFVTFLDESTINTENTTIEGKKGTYDADKEIGNFDTRSTVSNDEQQIVANKMYHDNKKGISKANGNVVINDFKNNRKLLADRTNYNEKTGVLEVFDNIILYDEPDGRTLFADYAYYNKPAKYTKATGKVWVYDSLENTILNCSDLQLNQTYDVTKAKGNPVLRMLADKDSLFIKADSFFSAPAYYIDTIKSYEVPNIILIKDSVNKAELNAEPNKKDTAVKRTLLALNHVKIFGDSMQAIADSVSYSQLDSIFKLYKNPMLWTNDNQAIGDTIWLFTQNNKLKTLDMRGNASLISWDSIPNFYNQIIGRKIIGLVDSNTLQEMFVDGNAESIYFNKNDKNEYMGMNKSKSAQMKILMKEKKINRIIFYTEPEGTFFPLEKLSDADKKLDGFKWMPELRPNKASVVK